MSDSSINQFVAQFADATARTAFVPSPPTPAADGDNGYFAFQQDDSSIWCWDSNGSAWVQVGNGSGVNTVSAVGTLTSGEPVLGAGSKAVAVGPINLAGGATFVTGDLPFANLAQGSALSVLGVTGNSTADNASIAAGSDHQVLRRSGTAVAFGQVNLAQSAAVTGVLPVANGGTGSATGAGLLRATVTLTDAQVKALPTTPFTIVAAPGAGFYVAWQAVELITFFAAGAYTGLNATYCVISCKVGGLHQSIAIVNDSTTTPALTMMTRFLGAANRHVRLCPYIEAAGGGGEQYIIPSTADGTNGIDAIGSLDNQTMTIEADNNGTGAFTGGNAANTLKVVVYYTIEATS